MPVNNPLLGYDTEFGAKKSMVMEHFGPASYVQMPTGNVINAQDIGWGGIDFVDSAYYSNSGTYYVEVVYAGTGARGSVKSVALRWVVVATGAEVAAAVNLSAEIIRLFMLGA